VQKWHSAAQSHSKCTTNSSSTSDKDSTAQQPNCTSLAPQDQLST